MVKEHVPGEVRYAGEVVTYRGATYQVTRDTAELPGDVRSYIQIATAGRDGMTPTIRGTFDLNGEYHYLDVVALNGSSFIAKNDKPGACPGEGWQLIASAGKRGEKGDRGEPGAKGTPGAPGAKGEAAPTILKWVLDAANYQAVTIMSDGTKGAILELRPMFKQFAMER
jgi:hypothetical protein